jgi:hypothetical protein
VPNYGRCKSFKFKGGRARRICTVETVEVNVNSETWFLFSCSWRRSDGDGSIAIVVPIRAIDTTNQKKKTMPMMGVTLVFVMTLILRQ